MKFENIYYQAPTVLQNIMVSASGLVKHRKKFNNFSGKNTEQLAKEWDYSDTYKTKIQRKLYRNIVEHAIENVPFYSKWVQKEGVSPIEAASIENINQFPIVTKDIILEKPDDFLAKNIKTYHINRTSGSSRAPMSTHFCKYSYQLSHVLLETMERSLGCSRNRKLVTLSALRVIGNRYKGKNFFRSNLADNQYIFDPYYLTKSNSTLYLEQIMGLSPEEIVGFPSLLVLLIDYVTNLGVKSYSGEGLKLVVTNSEKLYDWQREKISNFFLVPTIDYYSTSESTIFCKQDSNSNYSPHPRLGFGEVMSSSSGDKLLTTSLSNFRMPLLRYEIGDCVVADTNEYGIVKNIYEIEGRVEENIISPLGNTITHLGKIANGMAGLKAIQIVYERSIDKYTVNYVSDNSENIGHDIKRRLIDKVSYEPKGISLNRISEIPRESNGKTKVVKVI